MIKAKQDLGFQDPAFFDKKLTSDKIIDKTIKKEYN